jgi:hypothetical protein
MSAIGTKRTYRAPRRMSSVGGKADMAGTYCDVRFWELSRSEVGLPNSTAIFVVLFLNKGAKI